MFQSFQGELQLFFVGQEYDAEMVGCWPVKSATLNHQHLLLAQQIEHKLFVIMDVELFDVDFREQIERSRWLNAGDPVDVVEHAPGELALLVQQLVDHVVAAGLIAF